MRDYYRILDCLGAGAFGEVRKCVYREKSVENKSFYKQYRAVKIIAKNYMDKKGYESFYNEVETMLILNNQIEKFAHEHDKKAMN